MITNGGKEIISKYMLGQVNAYATHLSVGCGAFPLRLNENGQTLDVLLKKEYLDFEMTRVPITSKGFVDNSVFYTISTKSITSSVATIVTDIANDINIGEIIVLFDSGSPYNGTHIVTGLDTDNNEIQVRIISPNLSPTAGGRLQVIRTSLSLTAELPADNRYAITEVGIWSAPNNALAANFDSRSILTFTNGWQEHAISINDPQIVSDFGSSSDINQNVVPYLVFYAPTDNEVFSNTVRRNRKEGPRFLNRSLLIRGDSCDIGGLAGQWSALGVNELTVPTHVHLNNVNFDISRNSPSDRLNLAFSLVDRDATGNPLPSKVKMIIEFLTTETTEANGFARIEVLVNGTDFTGNRYKTINIPISQGINEESKITATVIAASGNGEEITYTTVGAHSFEVGQEISVTGLPTGYNLDREEIVAIGVDTFTVEGGASGSLTGLSVQASAYPNARLITAQDFTPSNIRVARIFSTVLDAEGNPSQQHYVAFDGLRIENVTTVNPLYKMTGYSVVRNVSGYPLIKSQRTNNFIEFRFDLGVS
jgi:hypothetical protein